MKKTKLTLRKKLNLVKEIVTPLDQRRSSQIRGGSFILTGCAETLEPLFCETRDIHFCQTKDVNSVTPVCCVAASKTCDTLQQSCGGACPVPTLGCP
ncbi:class I lanthipeptide [Taibaiella koreensis]|uniref:class I lanthipeptide n=1 Tax=Taibaiella koreensis TaxID=1268548 RepID=UPI001968DFC2